MDYFIDNFEYRQPYQLWINRVSLLRYWDELDDLFLFHKERLFRHPELIDAWIQRFLQAAWAQYPAIDHEVLL